MKTNVVCWLSLLICIFSPSERNPNHQQTRSKQTTAPTTNPATALFDFDFLARSNLTNASLPNRKLGQILSRPLALVNVKEPWLRLFTSHWHINHKPISTSHIRLQGYTRYPQALVHVWVHRLTGNDPPEGKSMRLCAIELREFRNSPSIISYAQLLRLLIFDVMRPRNSSDPCRVVPTWCL